VRKVCEASGNLCLIWGRKGSPPLRVFRVPKNCFHGHLRSRCKRAILFEGKNRGTSLMLSRSPSVELESDWMSILGAEPSMSCLVDQPLRRQRKDFSSPAIFFALVQLFLKVAWPRWIYCFHHQPGRATCRCIDFFLDKINRSIFTSSI
jgi:hypothetical protein